QVLPHPDHQPLEHLAPPADDVEVSIVDRVERPRIDRDARVQLLHDRPFSSSTVRSISSGVLYACGLTRSRPARWLTATPCSSSRFLTWPGSTPAGATSDTMPDRSCSPQAEYTRQPTRSQPSRKRSVSSLMRSRT